MLAGIESMIRGMLVSVFPFIMYRAFGDAAVVSRIYFLIGTISLPVSMTPGVAVLILVVARLLTVFGAAGAGLLGMYALAGRLHPLLGVPRHARPAAAPAE